MIRLDHVTKEYDGFTAVEDLSLTIEEGEICVLLGPSGCGKSTTLRMINRLIDPNSGDIFVNNINIFDYQPDQLRQSIGYVVQSTGLFPHLTVEKNISVVPELLHWDRKKIAKRIDELLILVGLNSVVYRGKYPSELSGGEAQRVGVARALAADPPIILMDEPFGAVDPLNRKNLQDAFLEIQTNLHKTIVFVTHDVEEAIHMGDKIAVLNQGHLEAYADPKHLIKNNVNPFVRSFLGQEYLLKMLGKFTLKDVPYYKDVGVELNKAKLKESKSLKEALALMIEQSVNEIIAVDEKGRFLGVVKLESIINILQDPRASKS